MRSSTILKTIRAYDDWVVRGYCWGRFWILRQRFLDEIGQYLPSRGRVLDIGCGCGLVALYSAQTGPGVPIVGVDRSERRIEMARRAARRLGLTNVSYVVGDATDYRCDGEYSAVYMLDIIHHIPEETVRPLLEQLYKSVTPDGVLLVKDVDTKPALKRLFTHGLDLLMDPGGTIHYWSAESLQSLLEEVGFTVRRHLMVDLLPYPHVLYVGEPCE
jgi:2-polyprenyl-3-methyl-5-hydroxy-6-metoxy-1,4-benzoquinol methylase